MLACVGAFALATNKHGLRVIASVLVYVLAIVAIHAGLGGLRQSGGVIIWILIAPPLIMMGHRPRTGIQCAVMIAALLAFLVMADPSVVHRGELRMVAVNMAGFALFIWFAVGFYVWRSELQNRSLTRLAVANERSQLALFDALTGIPNREGAKQVAAACFPLTVLVIDLDRFKAVNTALGRALGDQVLILFTRRLATLQFVSLGRLHADRFVMLWPGDPDAAHVDAVIAGVLDAPLEIDAQVIDLSATVGVARCATAADLELTMRNAETAMSAARQRHRRLLEYTAEMQRHRRGDLSLMSDLNQAIAKQELRMVLQPKVLLRDGSVDSAEALIRWQHPVRGMVPPMDFIPFAEQTGRIRLLTNWILHEAMMATVLRRRRGGQIQISVNVCAADLADPHFEAAVLDLVRQTQVVVSDIRFEVTESGLMEQPDVALALMTRLQSVGFSWSIDDFGTGYSSLSYLQKMPVAELKIDRAFVKGLGDAQHNSKLLRSAIRMGHELGLSVVCEGAETAQEWAGLLALGADYAQGWYASAPLPADQFDEWCRLCVPFATRAAADAPTGPDPD
ncbi:MAG: bifunctional diguanylate cyclase/phosphodiesterase [Pseudomonadota bacterium]|nr:bifunctional diguanylate cyclase/phosphodiesterase [Pseudomonadota bacterium]